MSDCVVFGLAGGRAADGGGGGFLQDSCFLFGGSEEAEIYASETKEEKAEKESVRVDGRKKESSSSA